MKAFGELLLRLLKPIGKLLAIKFVEAEGDYLQGILKAEVQKHGPSAVDRCFDVSQARVSRGLRALKFLPESVQSRIYSIVMEEGDKLQEKARVVVVEMGIGGIDTLVDATQKAIIAKIQAL